MIRLVQVSVVKFSDWGKFGCVFVFYGGIQLHRNAFLLSTSCCLPKSCLLHKTHPQLHSHKAILRVYTVTYTDKCASCVLNILSRLVSQFHVIYSILMCCVLIIVKMGYIKIHNMMVYWQWCLITVCWEGIQRNGRWWKCEKIIKKLKICTFLRNRVLYFGKATLRWVKSMKPIEYFWEENV